jgi:hypothetical protein
MVEWFLYCVCICWNSVQSSTLDIIKSLKMSYLRRFCPTQACTIPSTNHKQPCQILYIGIRRISTKVTSPPPHFSERAMAPQRLCIGNGAHCSVLVKYLHPSKEVEEAIVNPIPGQRLDDLMTVSRQGTQQKGKSFRSIFFCSDTIPGVNLHAAE